jgi:hypothetical protein
VNTPYRHFQTSGTGDWSVTRYTFRRPYDHAAATSPEPIPQRGPIGVAPLGSGQSARPHGAELAGSVAAEPVTAVRLTACWLPDNEPAGGAIEGRGQGLAAGRVLVRREVAYPLGQADIDEIESLRAEYETPGVSKDRREQISDAAADYAASWVEGQFGVTWWQASRSLSLSQAAGLLGGSAEWLRGLVEHPLADAASAAGAAGPVVDIGAGITANFVTAPLTRPLEGAARGCEIAGIVIGLATGAHPLVLACAKRLAHDEVGQVLSSGFEQAIRSIGAAPEPPGPTAPALPPPPTTPGASGSPGRLREPLRGPRTTQGPPGSSAPATDTAAERYKKWIERLSGPPSSPPPPSGPQAPGTPGPGAPGV